MNKSRTAVALYAAIRSGYDFEKFLQELVKQGLEIKAVTVTEYRTLAGGNMVVDRAVVIVKIISPKKIEGEKASIPHNQQ